MPVLLAGAIEIPWYFYVVAILAIVGLAAVLLLPITIPLALAHRRDGESVGKLAAKYTAVGLLPAAFLGYAVREARVMVLLALYVTAWVVAYSSMSTSAGRNGPKAHAGR